MTRSFPLIGTNALLIVAALMFAGCGVGSGVLNPRSARQPIPTCARSRAVTRRKLVLSSPPRRGASSAHPAPPR